MLKDAAHYQAAMKCADAHTKPLIRSLARSLTERRLIWRDIVKATGIDTDAHVHVVYELADRDAHRALYDELNEVEREIRSLRDAIYRGEVID